MSSGQKEWADEAEAEAHKIQCAAIDRLGASAVATYAALVLENLHFLQSTNPSLTKANHKRVDDAIRWLKLILGCQE